MTPTKLFSDHSDSEEDDDAVTLNLYYANDTNICVPLCWKRDIFTDIHNLRNQPDGPSACLADLRERLFNDSDTKQHNDDLGIKNASEMRLFTVSFKPDDRALH